MGAVFPAPSVPIAFIMSYNTIFYPLLMAAVAQCSSVIAPLIKADQQDSSMLFRVSAACLFFLPPRRFHFVNFFFSSIGCGCSSINQHGAAKDNIFVLYIRRFISRRHSLLHARFLLLLVSSAAILLSSSIVQLVAEEGKEYSHSGRALGGSLHLAAMKSSIPPLIAMQLMLYGYKICNHPTARACRISPMSFAVKKQNKKQQRAIPARSHAHAEKKRNFAHFALFVSVSKT